MAGGTSGRSRAEMKETPVTEYTAKLTGRPMGAKRLRPLKVVGYVILGIFIICMVSCNIIFPPPPSMEKVEKIFQNDKEILEPIADNFIESGYALIGIDTSRKSGYMYAIPAHGQIGEDVLIKNPQISNKIDILFDKKGYEGINKRDNTVYFQRWADLRQSIGIAYTTDGSIPDIEYLTKYASLSEENWFYYETDSR